MAFKIPTQPIQDDRAPTVIKFIEERYQLHRFEHPNAPFFIGLNGVQGAGKTTLVKNLENALMEKGWETLVFSIDDFYLRREDQLMLAKLHSSNMLVQHRGEPGTHDMGLARKVFADLKEGKEVKIPQYEKKWFNGQGDRVREDFWYQYNGKDQKKVQIIIFEGWCVGYRSITDAQLEQRYSEPSRTLQKHDIDHLQFINYKLRDYDLMTDSFDAFVHIDAENPEFAYDWRKEQEEMLREKSGSGMTDQEVEHFVDGYFPAYELYLDGLRRGVFLKTLSSGKVDVVKSGPRQLRLVVGKDRKVIPGGVSYIGS